MKAQNKSIRLPGHHNHRKYMDRLHPMGRRPIIAKWLLLKLQGGVWKAIEQYVCFLKQLQN